MQDIAGRMLDDFARRFEHYLLHGEEAEQAPSGAEAQRPDASTTAASTPQPSAPADQETALDLGSAVFGTPAVQRTGLAFLAGLLLAIVLFRGRRNR
jgi:hypothetical protein